MKVFGIAGYSGSGKTTLLENVIPLLTGRGLRVSVVKHAHHAFDVDKPGKDSYRHRAAGATEVLISSGTRWTLMHELRDQAEPELPQLLAQMSDCDLVLVEGFKRQPIPKMEIHRAAANTPVLYPEDPMIVAIASDRTLETALPVFRLDDYPAIADYIAGHARAALNATRR